MPTKQEGKLDGCLFSYIIVVGRIADEMSDTVIMIVM